MWRSSLRYAARIEIVLQNQVGMDCLLFNFPLLASFLRLDTFDVTHRCEFAEKGEKCDFLAFPDDVTDTSANWRGHVKEFELRQRSTTVDESAHPGSQTAFTLLVKLITTSLESHQTALVDRDGTITRY